MFSRLTHPFSSNSIPSLRKSSSIKFGSPKCIFPVKAPNLFTTLCAGISGPHPFNAQPTVLAEERIPQASAISP